MSKIQSLSANKTHNLIRQMIVTSIIMSQNGKRNNTVYYREKIGGEAL